jgi:hypothetical protein
MWKNYHHWGLTKQNFARKEGRVGGDKSKQLIVPIVYNRLLLLGLH